LNVPTLQIDKLTTTRLILVPYTIEICNGIIKDDFNILQAMGLKKGRSWPDADVMDTLPKIINNLSAVAAPTGFESWMIIKADTLEIIGDAGFKGFNYEERSADLGYGIIKEERKRGYAFEATAALINWAFSNETVREITARCLVGNAASINLLRKMNFMETKFDDEMVCWTLGR
jgi:ribosomal-protein-alanine N-acetyltransferase